MNTFKFSGAAVLLCLCVSNLSFAQNLINGKVFNPDLSMNLLGSYRYNTDGSNVRTDSGRNGFTLDESEIQFRADVDAYFRANALLAIVQEDGEFGIEPEEAYLETLSLPQVTLRAGKFRAAFGRHNMLHVHAFPFIDAPLMNQDLLGDEGVNDVGVSAAILFPASWFTELTLQAMANNNEVLFNSDNSKHIAPIINWRNLWDLSDNLTLESDFFGTYGPNQFDSESYAYGSDFILRWRPMQGGGTGGKYKSWIWQTQYMHGVVNDNPAGESLGGIASWIRYQFAQRWWVQVREEYEGLPHSSTLPTKHKQSLLLAFFPSEFSGLRLQYDTTQEQGLNRQHAVTLQYSISIGFHPAHQY